MPGRGRPFGLADLMILIVALAVGIWYARELGSEIFAGLQFARLRNVPIRLIVATLLSAFATPLTVAGLVFRLKRPRPVWRRLAMRPGTAAILACSLIFVLRGVEVVAAFARPHIGPPLTWSDPASTYQGFQEAYKIRGSNTTYLAFIQDRSFGSAAITPGVTSYLNIPSPSCFGVVVASYAYPCGYAVAAVWLLLAASGRWRTEKTWIDRFGITLGFLWITISTLTAIPV